MMCAGAPVGKRRQLITTCVCTCEKTPRDRDVCVVFRSRKCRARVFDRQSFIISREKRVKKQTNKQKKNRNKNAHMCYRENLRRVCVYKYYIKVEVPVDLDSCMMMIFFFFVFADPKPNFFFFSHFHNENYRTGLWLASIVVLLYYYFPERPSARAFDSHAAAAAAATGKKFFAFRYNNRIKRNTNNRIIDVTPGRRATNVKPFDCSVSGNL